MRSSHERAVLADHSAGCIVGLVAIRDAEEAAWTLSPRAAYLKAPDSRRPGALSLRKSGVGRLRARLAESVCQPHQAGSARTQAHAARAPRGVRTMAGPQPRWQLAK